MYNKRRFLCSWTIAGKTNIEKENNAQIFDRKNIFEKIWKLGQISSLITVIQRKDTNISDSIHMCIMICRTGRKILCHVQYGHLEMNVCCPMFNPDHCQIDIWAHYLNYFLLQNIYNSELEEIYSYCSTSGGLRPMSGTEYQFRWTTYYHFKPILWFCDTQFTLSHMKETNTYLDTIRPFVKYFEIFYILLISHSSSSSGGSFWFFIL